MKFLKKKKKLPGSIMFARVSMWGGIRIMMIKPKNFISPGIAVITEEK